MQQTGDEFEENYLMLREYCNVGKIRILQWPWCPDGPADTDSHDDSIGHDDPEDTNELDGPDDPDDPTDSIDLSTVPPETDPK